MVRERHEDRVSPGGGEERGMNEPIEVTAVFLSRAGGMSDSAVPVPLGREIRGVMFQSPPMSHGTPPMPASVS